MALNAYAIQQVWLKARPSNYDNLKFDRCGALIKRSDYGNRRSKYGWEIDHIIPNGNDHITNLQPLHWHNNASKSNGRLKCSVRFISKKNYLV